MYTGTQSFAASALSFFSIIVFLMARRIKAAITQPMSGDSIHEAIICPILLQFTIQTQCEVIPAPMIPPMIE